MIIRILGQGQWVMEPEQLIALNEIDAAVEKAVADGDSAVLKQSLEDLVAAVRNQGVEVPDEVLAESDLVLPDVDSSVEEVRALLDSQSEYYGLIPDAENLEGEADVLRAEDVEPGSIEEPTP